MKKYIDLDEDPGEWKTASQEVLETARHFCKQNPDIFDEKTKSPRKSMQKNKRKKRVLKKSKRKHRRSKN
jgi:hypothetical protein